MKASIARTQGRQVLAGLGGFAGLWDAAELRDYQHPVLATSTDGVGTKLAIAQALDRHSTIGLDLVAMVVDDLVVCGAKPLFMTDYIACGRVQPAKIAAIVEGIALGCELTGTALVSGETAEHPGVMAPDEYDIAGAAVGVVEKANLLGAHRVAQGDQVIGLASSGLHSNGYSLVRAIVQQLDWPWDKLVAEFGRTLGEELLEPTRLYTKACLSLAESLGADLHAFSHVTGGGLAANLARIVPLELGAIVSRAAWQVPPVFQVLHQAGRVPWGDLEQTLNLGIGMVAVVAAPALAGALDLLAQAGQPAVPIGQIVATGELAGEYGARTATSADLTQGTKGQDGGQVLLVDAYN